MHRDAESSLVGPDRFDETREQIAPRVESTPRGDRIRRAFVFGFSALVLIYSFSVLTVIAWMGEIGVRCVLTLEIREPVSPAYAWSPAPPEVGSVLQSIGPFKFRHYSDFVQALKWLGGRVGRPVEVTWLEPAHGDSAPRLMTAEATVRHRPAGEYLASVVWFLQEMFIFFIGGWVYWKRPRDDSARLFFWLCIVTVGAYMGGYHWTEDVVEPLLIFPFAAFALYVPIVNLHFYLVFPVMNPYFARHRRAMLATLYGVPTIYLGALWTAMARARWFGDRSEADVVASLHAIRDLSYVYIGLSVVVFALCIVSLALSFRRAVTRTQRNQARWILLAALGGAFFIGLLLRQVLMNPSILGREAAAWPMFAVSMLFTIAYALSITRYKLMQVEEIVNRSLAYAALSVTAGLIYSGVLLLGGMVIGERVFATGRTVSGALTAGLTVVLILVVLEVMRKRFQAVLDRRFHRDKYKLDQAMKKMRLAVGSLVDRGTLARRLLESASEVMRLDWGAIYLSEAAGEPFRLAAYHGTPPDDDSIALDNPLVARLRQSSSLRAAATMGLTESSDAATDAMIRLGGEAAAALEVDGDLAGLIVLGPKRSGLPYEEEEMVFLGALSSVASLAVHAAEIQDTLAKLNSELRHKVEKIAEQQRRILILQGQLSDKARGVVEGEQPSDASTTSALEHSTTVEPPSVFGRIKGSSPAVRRMIEPARKVASSTSAVLIRGETGTGKELLAEAIHATSPRALRPFVKVHCAALSQNLLESELFGHVRGAFTGADRDRVGRFEQADGGTLFLDEIGDINLEIQTKLLRVLQEMSFERVGSSQPIQVDVRVIAATHQDLETLIEAGRFREDLYYRLNVFSLETPPLRDRKDDIFELAVHFMGVHARRVGKVITHLDEEAVEALTAHDWPGNIRELENVVERAVVLSDGPALTLDDLPPTVRRPHSPRRRPRMLVTASGALATHAEADSVTSKAARRSDGSKSALHSWQTPDDVHDPDHAGYERKRLLEALDDAGGNKARAARLLGIPRSTLCSRLKKHGLE